MFELLLITLVGLAEPFYTLNRINLKSINVTFTFYTG